MNISVIKKDDAGKIRIGLNNRCGVSWLEILCLGFLLLSAYLGELFCSRFGTVAGIIGMVGFPMCLILSIDLLAWLERELIIGRKPFPPCLCGRHAIDELDVRADDKRLLRSCTCGRRYELTNAGRIVLLEDSGESEFARWKAFRGWELTAGKKLIE